MDGSSAGLGASDRHTLGVECGQSGTGVLDVVRFDEATSTELDEVEGEEPYEIVNPGNAEGYKVRTKSSSGDSRGPGEGGKLLTQCSLQELPLPE